MNFPKLSIITLSILALAGCNERNRDKITLSNDQKEDIFLQSGNLGPDSPVIVLSKTRQLSYENGAIVVRPNGRQMYIVQPHAFKAYTGNAIEVEDAKRIIAESELYKESLLDVGYAAKDLSDVIESAHKRSNDKINSMKQQISEDYTERNDKIERKRIDLDKRLAKKDKEYNEIQDAIKEREKELRKIKSEVSNKDDKIEELSSENNDKNEELVRKSHKLDEVTKNHNELTKEIENLKIQHAKLTEERNRLSTEVAASQQLLSDPAVYTKPVISEDTNKDSKESEENHDMNVDVIDDTVNDENKLDVDKKTENKETQEIK